MAGSFKDRNKLIQIRWHPDLWSPGTQEGCRADRRGAGCTGNRRRLHQPRAAKSSRTVCSGGPGGQWWKSSALRQTLHKMKVVWKGRREWFFYWSFTFFKPFFFLLQSNPWDFPDGPVVKILCSQYRGHRFDPWSGN